MCYTIRMPIIEKCVHGKQTIGKCGDCRKIYRDRDKKNDPRKMLWYAAKSRATKRRVPFSITLDDIVISERCVVLGIPLDYRDRNHAPSLDEIVPGKGYVKGNIAVISGRANRLKGDGTISDIQAIAAYIRVRTDARYGKF